MAAVYSREVAGDTLTLGASGWTYQNTFVLVDYETESLWYHIEGESGLRCISGFYADSFLPEFQSFFGRWSNWINQNPNTELLLAP